MLTEERTTPLSPGAVRTLRVARLVVFVASLDLFIQFPVVAPYLEALGAGPALAGAVVGAYSGANLVGNVLAGLALDRWGRRRPTLLGLVVAGLALGGYALARSPLQLLGVRVVHGLATAVLSPGAFALLGDTAPGDRRGRVMGTSGALIALSAVVGPALGGIVADRLGFGAVFLLGGALMIAVALAFARWAEETAGESERLHSRRMGRQVLGLVRRPRLVGAYLALLALTLGVGAQVAHLPLRMEAFGASGAGVGSAFTAYALTAMAMMLYPAGRLTDRWSRTGPMTVGLAIAAGAMGVLGGVPGVGGALGGMALFGLGFGLLFPAVTALVTDATALPERGTAFGIFYAVYSLGAVLGSALAGLVAEQAGTASGLPFLVMGALAMLAVPLIYRLAH